MDAESSSSIGYWKLSVIMIFGQLIHWPTIPTLILFPLILWAYARLANREEARLAEELGERGRDYQARVAKFVPRGGEWKRPYDAGRWESGHEERI